jgi:hypothetical protein
MATLNTQARRIASPAEPGFARREPHHGAPVDPAKEGAHGGTLGSPVPAS